MPDLDKRVGSLRCRDLLPLLIEYVEGTLGAAETERLVAHLRGCAECDKFGGEYGALVRALRSRPPKARLGAGVRARLAARMRQAWASEGDSTPSDGAT